MMKTTTAPKGNVTSRRLRWSTRDLLVAVAISIVFAIIQVGGNQLGAVLMAINPMFVAIPSGLFFLAGLLVMLIVRRPGACVLTRVVTALVTMAFSPFGWADLWMAVIFGLACEIPFAVTRYRRYNLLIACLGGVSAGLFSYAAMAAFGLFGVVPLGHILTAVGFVVSGAVIGGWLAFVLANAIAKTGVLNSFAIGQALQEEV
jgi:energy-coupling factor transport system substrate-specific component